MARKFNLAGDGEEGFVHADMMLEHVNDFIKGNSKYTDMVLKHGNDLSKVIVKCWYDARTC